jgi:class 3 adenylate cyclase
MRCNQYVICLIGFLLISIKLGAQQNLTWEDSVLTHLEIDRNVSLGVKNLKTDTLLDIYYTKQNTCKWIETAILKSRYLSLLGKNKDAILLVNNCHYLFEKKSCSEFSLLPKLYLEFSFIYYSQNEYKKAKLYAQKGIDVWQSSFKNKRILAELFCSKGDASEEFNEQILYTKKGYDIALADNDLEIQAKALNNLGCIYANAGENKKAIGHFKGSLAAALKNNSIQLISALYNNLAGLSSSSEEVELYLDSAKYYAAIKGDLEDLQTAYQNSALFHSSMGRYKKGYNDLFESLILKDSLYNLNKIKAFAEMEQKYEAEKKIAEINLLQKESELAKVKASRSLGINFGLGGALLGILSVAVTFYFQNKKKEKLNIALKGEKQKSDDLLLNILPAEVAEELKLNGQSTARQYNNVSVLFTDFVNFTGISEQMSPSDLVQEIHQNFKTFDAIMEKHGIEKIKTIGDAYLAVCGLPIEVADHANRIIEAALDIQDFMQTNNGKFQIRIGINTGPVIAGIVGVKKFAYDIWGDTVNTAARMEQNSLPGKINVSSSTYELVKNDFTFIHRGKVDAKNKGMIDMYFVEV